MCKKIQDFLTNKEKVKLGLYWMRKVWYVLLLVLSSVYVGCNFCQFVTQSFITKLDGNSLIFILWLILLILPLFNSIEGYGFKLSKDREEQERQTMQIQLLQDDLAKHFKPISKEELDEMFKSVKNKE